MGWWTICLSLFKPETEQPVQAAVKAYPLSMNADGTDARARLLLARLDTIRRYRDQREAEARPIAAWKLRELEDEEHELVRDLKRRGVTV